VAAEAPALPALDGTEPALETRVDPTLMGELIVIDRHQPNADRPDGGQDPAGPPAGATARRSAMSTSPRGGEL